MTPENTNKESLMAAIRARHSVRRYDARPVEPEKAEALRAAIESANSAAGLHIQLVLDEPKAFSSKLVTYGQFTGVRNYLVMAGPKGRRVEENVGYYGERLVLLAQTLGLNSCWVGLTYRKIPGAFTLAEGEVVHCVIALGYGLTPGVQHPLRPAGGYYECDGEPPQWFLDGMEAAMLAPTAVNQQKFRFILHPGGEVEAKPLFSMIGYTHVDLGIVKCHFEIGAGKVGFLWK
ncbi:MAG: nitroreductase [Bacteroidales bacterium]|nr:nitroreductase [Bacteroidales bacterium]